MSSSAESDGLSPSNNPQNISLPYSPSPPCEMNSAAFPPGQLHLLIKKTHFCEVSPRAKPAPASPSPDPLASQPMNPSLSSMQSLKPDCKARSRKKREPKACPPLSITPSVSGLVQFPINCSKQKKRNTRTVKPKQEPDCRDSGSPSGSFPQTVPASKDKHDLTPSLSVLAEPCSKVSTSPTSNLSTDQLAELVSANNLYVSLPPTDFSVLKEILSDYLFGCLSPSRRYPISQKELFVLRYLLRRKFFYSSKTSLTSKLDSLTTENCLAFLLAHPQRKRTQLFKRMVFTKFWRYATVQGGDVLGRFFNGDRRYDYKDPANNSGGNPTNEYYERCLLVPQFAQAFSNALTDKRFWEEVKAKSVRSFNLNFGKWMKMIDSFLEAQPGVEEERKMLMKIKFMSLDANPKRIKSIFGL